MADAEEREKAEKLAAAKKRFEQLKKQKEKTKKGGAQKKKEDTSATNEAPAEASPIEPRAEASRTGNADSQEAQRPAVDDEAKGSTEPSAPSDVPPKP
ncbi:MAG: hypothetical protein Q9211_004793, partial [Gyalolechia sp. 1 TL-2023]